MLDLDKIGKLGRYQFTYKGVGVCQRIGVWKFLDSLVEELEDLPKIIIELGTMHGGWTSVLSEHEISNNATIHTFDSRELGLTKFFESFDNISFHFGDMFSYEHKKLIESLIKDTDGIVLVFCDGGNKRKEFKTFSPYLKKGDCIFGHDYVKTRGDYVSTFHQRIWDWHELKYDDIKESVETHSLKPLLEDIASQYVWASFKKP